jgi:heat shock protein HtpX
MHLLNIQGVVNAFSLFLSRVVAYAISTALRDEGGRGFSLMTYYLLSFVFDILFTLLGSILVCAFSRWREFHADAGGAKLTGTSNMVAALKQLQNMTGIEQDKRGDALNSLKIAHRDGWMSLFSTHPPLDERIARLERKSL